MRVSIIGAGRNRNGIGEYIGKYFHAQGAEVTSVLGTREETSERATVALRKYGILATPYTSFQRMVEKEKPDVVVIASPSSTHSDYLAKCHEMGLAVFCEKPFVWQAAMNREKLEKLLEGFRDRGLTVAMNCQWPFAIKDYEAISGKIDVRKENEFYMAMSPFASGKEMIPESLPHALSLLNYSYGEGAVNDVGFRIPRDGEMLIRFKYLSRTAACEVNVKLASQRKQPRDFEFGFNGRIVIRRVDLKQYGITFHHGAKEIQIVDPLERSVQDFIKSFKEKREPLIGPSHILSTTLLLNKIHTAYVEFERR